MTRHHVHVFNPNDYYGLHPATLKDRFPELDLSKHFKTSFALSATLPGKSSGTTNDRQSAQRIFRRVSEKEFLAKEHFITFLYQKYQRGCKFKTLTNYCAAIIPFLCFVESADVRQLDQISRQDIEAFVEHEQDRGMKPATLRLRLMCIHSFLQYLNDAEKIPSKVLKRKLRIKLPKALPRAMDPADVKQLLSIVHDVRDRAMILIMLRTGLRIGEVLNLKMADVQLGERKLLIYEGEKNYTGRVVCLSADACDALQKWLFIRDTGLEVVFYSRWRRPMAYGTARKMFMQYLEKAGLSHKRHTLHGLRHTFATDLLNAGMRIECLQQLLGHSSLEMTLRYARLSDKTREKAYFKAMAIIEGEKKDEPEQLDHQLPASFETQELLTTHHQKLFEPSQAVHRMG